MIFVGAAILLVSCVVCGLAPSDNVPALAVGLFLLGLGWSFTLIAGSTLVTDDVEENERPSVQGLSDLTMNVAAAGGGAVAGFIVAGASYAVLCTVATIPVLVLVGLAASPAMRRRSVPAS
jgi:MFS family permease